MEGKRVELERLAEFGVYEVVDKRPGQKTISTKWEIQPRWDANGKETRRARFVCREFASGAPTMEYFSPSSSHASSR
eukprot:631854-Prorocentrum_lima.AAC.1